MQPLPFALNEQARIVLFDSEEALDEAMAAEEELEGMLPEAQLDVGTLVEEQILMALPYAPCHESCHSDKLDAVNQDRPNPFAALAAFEKWSFNYFITGLSSGVCNMAVQQNKNPLSPRHAPRPRRADRPCSVCRQRHR